MSNDVSAIFYNPARLQNDGKVELLLMHNEWIQDVRSELIGVKFSIMNFPVAIGVNSTSISDIEVRTRPGEVESKFKAQYLAATIATSIAINENISVGVGFKYLYEDIFYEDASGYAVDFGAYYESVIENLSLALAIKNLGTMNQLKNQATKLPSDLRFGPVYSFNFEDLKLEVISSLEFQKYLNEDENHFNFASEIVYNNLLAFRIGYMSGYEARNITTGLGVNWKNLSFDYAMTPFLYQLGSGHSFSLKIVF
ncbi:MAG: hypothetical protein C0442_00245 [Chlorobiaceae bacterium]|nr:hypothetical protein [Chlorobiaceae bacterium]